MNQHVKYFLLLSCTAALAAGCSSSSGSTNNNNGGSSSTGGTGGTGPTGSVPLTPSPMAFVDGTNSLGVIGSWYTYADSLGTNGMPPGQCQTTGMHTDAQCSAVTAPAPGATFNVGTDGKICTSGTVETVLMLAGAMDYTNMWGAGMGLDFNNPGAAMGGKVPFDATAKGVTGIQFDIDAPPTAGIRVEFPDMATNNKAANYWGATSSYGPSPVKPGTNSFTWDKVTSPDMVNVPPFDPTTVMGIQFHVPSGTAGPYSFCISNLAMLK